MNVTPNQTNHNYFLSQAHNNLPPYPQNKVEQPMNSPGKSINLSSIHAHQDHEEGYNPLQIPADWELAKRHALARRTGPDYKKESGRQVQTCPCCGFEIDRQEIPFPSDPNSLSFLGSGFPLFYNFIRYCILILITQILVKQIYNLYTNYNGDYCARTKTEKFGDKKVEMTNCPQSLLLLLSVANKLDHHDEIVTVEMLNFIGLGLIMLLLLYFRKSQRDLDSKIDETNTTPADYTVCLKNIPTKLNVDYKWEISNIMENYALMDSEYKLTVKKVVLVYDIEEIVKLEKQMEKLIDKKKETIKKNNYNFVTREIDEQIEKLEHQIHAIEEEYKNTNKAFCGIAYVSYETEDMKDRVLQDNTHTWSERLCAYFNRGKSQSLTHEDLSWHDQKLFIEPAPEPNDIDWEFIHIGTSEKVVARIKSFILYAIFEGITFYVIYLISMQLAQATDAAHEEDLKGDIAESTLIKIKVFCYSISLGIVLFNKLGVAKILHYIVDLELISNKTKFQISYGRKYSVALFSNAALMSYIIDILILDNIIGYGGFIYNESLIFILNAILPPLVWLIDPWNIIKKWQRNREINDISKSVVTQQEANFLMEHPDYLSAKRYSDIMKTMWFTFFYGSIIPIGPVLSCIGLSFYYYIDLYNILTRRTVKESISKELSEAMIEMLEGIIFCSAIGEMIMSYAFYGEFSKYDILLLCMAIIYSLLPMEEISEKIFPTKNEDEVRPYDEGKLDFDTDYDRENPVTKQEAIKEWDQLIKAQELKDMKFDQQHQHHHHQQHQVQQFDELYKQFH